MLAAQCRSLSDVLRDSAHRFAGRTALVSADGLLTYAELNACVDGLAARLAAEGVGPRDRVGLCVDRGPLALIGSAALMRLGAAYVPLDVGNPAERLQHIVSDAALAVALCDEVGQAAVAGLTVSVIATGSGDAVPGPGVTPIDGGGPDDTAYVMYTSGSTGAPKGVEVTQRNLIALLRDAMPLFDLAGPEVWPLQHGHGFDVSVWEMWAGIASGATLLTVGGEAARAPEFLAELLLRHRATRLHIVPGVFRHLAEVVKDERLRMPMRKVVFCGEPIDYASIRTWNEVHGTSAPEWLNVYGITEMTVYNTVKLLSSGEIAAGATATPIGAAYPNSPAVVCDDELRPLPPGETGEILIGGAQVGRGYLNLPELTAARFVRAAGRTGLWYRTGDLARSDRRGELHYVGRCDDQVKIRGFRIELGEIDHAIRALPWVRDGAVVRHDSARGEPMLTAFVVTDATDRSLGRLRAELSRRLPEHMLPSRVVELSHLPLNSSGKTDRRALCALRG